MSLSGGLQSVSNTLTGNDNQDLNLLVKYNTDPK